MERIGTENWKGKDSLEVEEYQEAYVVVEHRKDKESREVSTTERQVPKSRVDLLESLLRSRCALGQKYGYKYVIRLLIEHHKWHEELGVPIEMFMDAFNGGSNRAKYYFPHYYYPMKVLEWKNKVTYLGRGGVILQ